VGMLVYILERSKEANRAFWLMLICWRSSIRCRGFLILNENGSTVRKVRMCERCWATLYAAALRQLMIGQMVVPGLWTLIRPQMFGGGFRLMNFHLVSCGTAILHELTVFLTLFWNFVVGSLGRVDIFLF
jgi:hypothetical protein